MELRSIPRLKETCRIQHAFEIIDSPQATTHKHTHAAQQHTTIQCTHLTRNNEPIIITLFFIRIEPCSNTRAFHTTTLKDRFSQQGPKNQQVPSQQVVCYFPLIGTEK